MAHVQIGAEKYWEEVEGFISGDKKFGFTKTKIYNISNSTNPLVAGFEIGLEKRQHLPRIRPHWDNRERFIQTIF